MLLIGGLVHHVLAHQLARVEFVEVDRVPAPGQIAHGTEAWAEPAGGGAVAAVQLLKLAGACDFYTALGGDDLGRQAIGRNLEHEVMAIALAEQQSSAEQTAQALRGQIAAMRANVPSSRQPAKRSKNGIGPLTIPETFARQD